MCDTCGCESGSPVIILKPGEDDPHQHTGEHDDNHARYHRLNIEHSHSPQPTHHDSSPHTHEIRLERDLLQRNHLQAERNRGYFEAKSLFALNLVSSPGSGKTSLLERTLKETGSNTKYFVIEGDQQSMQDADRIHALGVPVVQINTGNGCHLDAEMVHRAVKRLEVTDGACLVIENVGNLVCPSLFDLGESARVLVISVTEGEDKPLKYPNMFHSSHLCLINKIDLLPYLEFDVAKLKEAALRINPRLEFIECSVKTGEGIAAWYEWLKNKRKTLF